jgi:hypothetical protein
MLCRLQVNLELQERYLEATTTLHRNQVNLELEERYIEATLY